MQCQKNIGLLTFAVCCVRACVCILRCAMRVRASCTFWMCVNFQDRKQGWEGEGEGRERVHTSMHIHTQDVCVLRGLRGV